MLSSFKQAVYQRLKRWKEEAQLLGVLAFYRGLKLIDPRRGAPLFRPVLLKEPLGRRVLALAPHIDDEVLGCGGTLALHHQRGDRVTVVYLTDGAQGNPGGMSAEEVAAVRQQEAAVSAKLLGIGRSVFLGFPDQELMRAAEAPASLAGVLREEEPDAVYLPFPIDYHEDHVACTALLLKALEQTGQSPRVIFYECLIPIIPNVIIDISPVIDAKVQAVQAQRSQMATNDYIRVTPEGINRFRTHGLMAGRGYAEAFFAAGRDFLPKLLKHNPLLRGRQ